MMLKVDYTIDELLDHLNSIETADWLQYLINKDPIRSKFDDTFIKALLENSCQAALNMQQHLLRTYGQQTATAYAQLLGIELVEIADTTEFDFVYISTYTQPPPQITVYESALQIVSKTMQNSKYAQEINAIQFRELAIAHEIFHHLELHTPGIYTQQKILKYKALGIFSQEVSPISSSEVAAVHFSQILTGIQHFPLIYELIIQFDSNKLLVQELLDKLKSIIEKRGRSICK